MEALLAEILSDVRIYLKIANDDLSQDAFLYGLIKRASKKVARKRYPLGYTDAQEILAVGKYSDIIFDAVIYANSKEGGEFQNSHSENGIGRSWIDEDSLYTDIIPVVKVV